MIKIDDKLNKYLQLTQRALDKVKITKVNPKQAEDLLDLSKRYFKDAHFFKEKGDTLNAYGAVCYAHAFLDAGARIGLFDVDGDNELFMVDPKTE